MNDVSIQQIEIFLAVASSNSISAAARGLYISQPVVSDNIRSLESTLGFPLFVRNSRGVTLTDKGSRIYAELDPVYKRFLIAAETIFDNDACHNPKRLNIGSFHDLAPIRFMSAAVSAYKKLFPQYEVRSEYYNHNELREKLLTGELDVSFSFSYEVIGRPDVDCRRIAPLEQFFIVPQSYGLPDAGCDFGVLRDKTLILEVSSGRDVLLNICRAHGFVPKRIQYVNSYLLLSHMVAGGEGFTISGRNLPGKNDFKSRIVSIPVAVRDCNEYVHIVAVWRQDDERAILRDFVKAMEQPGIFTDIDPNQNRRTSASKWYN